ncbi:hypothetical protein L9F63_021613, partial [Diploptera punctata]
MIKILALCVLIMNIQMPGALSEPPELPPEPTKQQNSTSSPEQLEEETLDNHMFLEQLVKKDILAYSLWNITSKYNISYPVEECRKELEKNPDLISFYFVNITLDEMSENLHLSSDVYNYYNYDGSSAKNANSMYENNTAAIYDHELYMETVRSIMDTARK